MSKHTDDAIRFHLANPHVYDELVGMAREAKSHGATKLGIGQMFEVLRWNVGIQTDTWDFKLNNNYRAFYARLIMGEEPDLEDIFETRELRS